MIECQQVSTRFLGMCVCAMIYSLFSYGRELLGELENSVWGKFGGATMKD